MDLLAAIDQGTSSSRFLVFNPSNGELLASHQIEVNQICPQPGWVEMNPTEIYDTVCKCIDQACKKLQDIGRDPREIRAIGITNQRETIVAWDKKSGKPLCNAIVWLDTRTSEMADDIVKKKADCDREFLKSKTGLPIHPYFSALKIKWLLDNCESVQCARSEGTLMVGTVDTWLLWKLCGVYVTDLTNASRTNLVDLHYREWSPELCQFYEIPIHILPEIRSSAEVYGHLNFGLLEGVPIAGCLGDQQAALVGHNCINAGETKSTYGTGTFILCNTGQNIVHSKNGLLTTIAFQFGPYSPVFFALEGSGSLGGNVIRFLRDNLGFFQKPSDVEEIARSVDSTEDTYFVPCFTGLLAPYWDSHARGTISGITQRTNRGHICLAALKSVAFQTAELIEAINSDFSGSGAVLMLRTDGGMTANRLFNQVLSDTLGSQILCSKQTEITGWGAAIAAGLGIGLIAAETLPAYSTEVTIYHPKSSEGTRTHEIMRWKEAVKRSRNWAIQVQ